MAKDQAPSNHTQLKYAIENLRIQNLIADTSVGRVSKVFYGVLGHRGGQAVTPGQSIVSS